MYSHLALRNEIKRGVIFEVNMSDAVIFSSQGGAKAVESDVSVPVCVSVIQGAVECGHCCGVWRILLGVKCRILNKVQTLNFVSNSINRQKKPTKCFGKLTETPYDF